MKYYARERHTHAHTDRDARAIFDFFFCFISLRFVVMLPFFPPSWNFRGNFERLKLRNFFKEDIIHSAIFKTKSNALQT